MIAAAIAAAVAVAGVAAALLTLALKALDAERRCGGEKSGRAELAVRLESITRQRDDESRRADHEKERADALDDLLAETAVTGPVDGALDRLLQRWRAARAADREGVGVVPEADGAARPGSDDLLPLDE